MNNGSVTFSAEEWRTVQSQFGELKHSVNNALAVFMAFAELSKRNPDNYEKLINAINNRTPEVVTMLQQFSELIDGRK